MGTTTAARTTAAHSTDRRIPGQRALAGQVARCVTDAAHPTSDVGWARSDPGNAAHTAAWEGEIRLAVSRYFSRRTPLKGPPLVFWSMNRPVFVSRFVQLPLTGFWACERSRTAPWRRLSPYGLLVAMIVCLSAPWPIWSADGKSSTDIAMGSDGTHVRSDVLAGALLLWKRAVR